MSRPDVADAEVKNRGGFRNHRWATIHNTVRLAADELVGHHLHHPAPGSRGRPRRRRRRRRSVMARPRSVGCSAREKDRKGIGQDPAARRNRVRHEAAGMAQREPAAAYARTARARGTRDLEFTASTAVKMDKADPAALVAVAGAAAAAERRGPSLESGSWATIGPANCTLIFWALIRNFWIFEEWTGTPILKTDFKPFFFLAVGYLPPQN